MNLVYQAYGHQDILEQSLFSIVSLIFHTDENSEIQAIVYTDQPEWFHRFLNGAPQVSVVEINQQSIQKWRGEIDFVHRVKIEVLKDAGQKFDGSLFYCDGDTYFYSDPTALLKSVNDDLSLMHTKEAELGTQSNPLTKKIYKFVRNNVFTVSGEQIFMDQETEMWNAGFIGLSHKNKSFLNHILDLTDQMYSKYPKHVMEQLAVSYILQSRTQIKAAEDVIHHYWNQKPAYQLEIQRFLGDYTHLETALKAYRHFQFPEEPKPPVSLLKQVFQKLFTSRPRA